MQTRRPSGAWTVVALLFFSGALNYGDRTAISSVLPLIRADLHMSETELGLIGSVFLWSYALGSVGAGILADRLSRSRVIIASLAAWSLVTLLTGFASTTWQLLTARALLGLAECFYIPAAVGLIADYHPARTRGTAIGLHTGGLSFGLVAGGTLAGWLGDHFGWRPSFLVLGLAGLALASLCLLILRDRPDQDQTSLGAPPVLESLRLLASLPSYWIILAESLLVSVGTWMFLHWLPLFYRETYSISLTAAGFSGTFMLQAAGSLGVITGGVVSDHIVRKGIRRRLLGIAICHFLAAPFLAVFFAAPAMLLLNGAIFAYAFLRSLGSANEIPFLCDLLTPKFRSTAVGIMNFFNALAGGIGVFVAGFLKEQYGLAANFGSVSLIMLTACALALAGYRWFAQRDLDRQALKSG